MTERDIEVLTCLGKGMSNAQIGAQLHLTEATVKGYVSRVLTKAQTELNCFCCNIQQSDTTRNALTDPLMTACDGRVFGLVRHLSAPGWASYLNARNTTPDPLPEPVRLR